MILNLTMFIEDSMSGSERGDHLRRHRSRWRGHWLRRNWRPKSPKWNLPQRKLPIGVEQLQQSICVKKRLLSRVRRPRCPRRRKRKKVLSRRLWKLWRPPIICWNDNNEAVSLEMGLCRLRCPLQYGYVSYVMTTAAVILVFRRNEICFMVIHGSLPNNYRDIFYSVYHFEFGWLIGWFELDQADTSVWHMRMTVTNALRSGCCHFRRSDILQDCRMLRLFEFRHPAKCR